MSRTTSQSSGEGALRVDLRFKYVAFGRSTSSSLKPKTLIEGPFDGLRTVYRPPFLFTLT